ncbi:MAG: hypothetical protein KAJ19_24340, partial [Gammaproteobacteria bacterium]|nr:hypothetical protein [Gammaproteobacteria bacterium]
KPRKGRKQAPLREVLKETTQVVGRGCIRVAVLECGHIQRIGLGGGGRKRLRCRQCPEEYE